MFLGYVSMISKCPGGGLFPRNWNATPVQILTEKQSKSVMRLNCMLSGKIWFYQTIWKSGKITIIFSPLTLHKKWSSPLRIYSVNVTKFAVSCGFGHIFRRNPLWKTSFFVQCEFSRLLWLTLIWRWEMESSKTSKTSEYNIHCNDTREYLGKPESLESWKKLVVSATGLQHKKVLEIVRKLPENEIENVSYQ